MSRSSNLTWLEREAQQLPKDELLRRVNNALKTETSGSGTHIIETLINEIACRICHLGEGVQLTVDEVVDNVSDEIVSGVLVLLESEHKHIYQLAQTLRGEYEAEYKEMRRDLLGDNTTQYWSNAGTHLPGIFDMDADKVVERQAEMQKKLEKHGKPYAFLYSNDEYQHKGEVLGYSQVYYFNPEAKFPDLPSANYRYGDSEETNDLLDKINTTRCCGFSY